MEISLRCSEACTRLPPAPIDGWLHPVQYGSSASEAIHALFANDTRTREVLDEVDAGHGDF